jgi:hypothetical protein
MLVLLAITSKESQSKEQQERAHVVLIDQDYCENICTEPHPLHCGTLCIPPW